MFLDGLHQRIVVRCEGAPRIWLGAFMAELYAETAGAEIRAGTEATT